MWEYAKIHGWKCGNTHAPPWNVFPWQSNARQWHALPCVTSDLLNHAELCKAAEHGLVNLTEALALPCAALCDAVAKKGLCKSQPQHLLISLCPLEKASLSKKGIQGNYISVSTLLGLISEVHLVSFGTAILGPRLGIPLLSPEETQAAQKVIHAVLEIISDLWTTAKCIFSRKPPSQRHSYHPVQVFFSHHV